MYPKLLLLLSFLFVISLVSGCTITVTSPATGDVWMGEQTIAWVSDACTGDYSLALSLNNGSSYTSVATLNEQGGLHTLSSNVSSLGDTSAGIVRVCDTTDLVCGVSGTFTLDATPPVMTLGGSSIITLALDDVYTDVGATALDAVSGDVSSSITTVSTVDTSALGNYSVTYTAHDSVGNSASAVRTVLVGNYTSKEASNVSFLFTRLPSGNFTLSVSELPNTSLPLTGFLTTGRYWNVTSSLTNGAFEVTLTFSYPDVDQNGVVDGTSLSEGALEAYFYNSTSSAWESVGSVTRDITANTVAVSVSHFTLFSLLVPVVSSSPSGDGSNSGGGGGGSGSSSRVSPVALSNGTSAAPASSPSPSPFVEGSSDSSADASESHRGSTTLTGAVTGALGSPSGVVVGTFLLILLGLWTFLHFWRR